MLLVLLLIFCVINNDIFDIIRGLRGFSCEKVQMWKCASLRHSRGPGLLRFCVNTVSLKRVVNKLNQLLSYSPTDTYLLKIE